MVAVLIVASVGSTVDYKKEVQFVQSRMKSDEKNVVSFSLIPCSPLDFTSARGFIALLAL